jgi:hypothetical protein
MTGERVSGISSLLALEVVFSKGFVFLVRAAEKPFMLYSINVHAQEE